MVLEKLICLPLNHLKLLLAPESFEKMSFTRSVTIVLYPLTD